MPALRSTHVGLALEIRLGCAWIVPSQVGGPIRDSAVEQESDNVRFGLAGAPVLFAGALAALSPTLYKNPAKQGQPFPREHVNFSC